MSVQDGVIQILANEGRACVSGEEIASQLGVSRAAVWKAIQKLQQDGYNISGTRNKGYTLEGIHDVLTERGIRVSLDAESLQGAVIHVKQRTGSTMDDVRDLANSGAKEFSSVIVGEQTAGRGRRGRPFYSPGNTGVYFSVLLRPNFPIEQAFLITGAAAVAVCRAIKETTGLEPSIKWVNDIYIDDMKVCGITTEAAADLETGGLSYAILGIGINVYEPEGGFPKEIATKAGALLHVIKPGLRNVLAAAVIKEFHSIYYERPFDLFVSEYKELSLMPGKPIMVINADNKELPAQAIAVNDDLSLQVQFENGLIENLQTGEVSIRI